MSTSAAWAITALLIARASGRFGAGGRGDAIGIGGRGDAQQIGIRAAPGGVHQVVAGAIDRLDGGCGACAGA